MFDRHHRCSTRPNTRANLTVPKTLTRDIEAVKHAIAEPWSSGQAEGQINRLKTLKRAMYGRASTELMRARMLPLPLGPSEHEK